MASVTADIDAQNTFTSGLDVKGNFDLSISGTFVGTVTVQRSFDGGQNWLDVDTFTGPVETFGSQPTSAVYRVGIKTGDYTSGTASVALYDEDLSQ